MGKKYFERNIFLNNFFRVTIVFCFCTLLFSMAFCGTEASADVNDSAPVSGKCGKHAVWSYDSATETLTISGSGAISKRINTGDESWQVKRILIQEGITAIDNCSAFWGMYYLENIEVSEGNRYFRADDDVLYSLDYETLVYYPQKKQSSSYSVNQNTKTIAPLAFAQNVELRKVVLPDGLTVLGSGAFYGCSALNEINLSREMNITAITDYDGTANWIVGDYIEWADEEVPFDTEYLKKGDSRQEISDLYLGTFEKTAIRSIVVPDSVRYMSSNTFFDSAVREISLGKDFQGGINELSCASNLKSLTLYCTNIEKVNLSPQNQRYCVEDNILYSKDKKILYRVLPSFQSEKLVIPDSVEEIANGAFFHNEAITDVVVPGNLKSIGQYAFYASDVVRFLCERSIGTIGKYAFSGCGDLKRFRCSEVSVIGSLAFCDCNSLAYFQIKNGARCNIRSIGKFAFSGCPFRTFRCGEIQEIKYGAFYGCQWLVTFYCTNVYTVGNSAFSYCSRLQVLHLGDNVKHIAEEALWGCESLMDITIPSSCVLETGEYKTFFKCSRLIRVKYRLPASQIELVFHPAVTGTPSTRKMITDGRIESFRAESLRQAEHQTSIFS